MSQTGQSFSHPKSKYERSYFQWQSGLAPWPEKMKQVLGAVKTIISYTFERFLNNSLPSITKTFIPSVSKPGFSISAQL